MQEINIGDKVRFLNDVGGGKVSGFQPGGIVLVEDADGFDIPVRQSEVVVVEKGEVEKIAAREPQEPKETPKGDSGIQKQQPEEPEQEEAETLEQRVLRLEVTVRRLQMRIERLEAAKTLREKVKAQDIERRELQRLSSNNILEIDLHADEVLESTSGMGPKEIKEYQLDIFHRIMEENKDNKGRKIVFIHGNGEGVLRKAIIDELRYKYKSCRFQDASFQQYGFGATMVTI